MKNQPILTHYISDMDKLLQQGAKQYPQSLSQKKECDKYRRIYALRDQVSVPSTLSKLWEQF